MYDAKKAEPFMETLREIGEGKVTITAGDGESAFVTIREGDDLHWNVTDKNGNELNYMPSCDIGRMFSALCSKILSEMEARNGGVVYATKRE